MTAKPQSASIPSNELVKYDAMCNAIAECERVDEVKDIRDKAVALAAYAKQARNFESERELIKIRLRAERRAGELLIEMREKGERAAPGQAGGKPSIDGKKVRLSISPTLSDLGIDKQQSSVWQQLAAISEEEFEIALEVNQPRAPTAFTIVEKYSPKTSGQPFDWREHWRGMPEFDQPDMMPVRDIIVHFYKLEDVEKFAELVGQKISPKTKYIDFPEQEIVHASNMRWVDKDDVDEGDLIEVLDLGSTQEKARHVCDLASGVLVSARSNRIVASTDECFAGGND